MAHYAIGDIQGCFDELVALLRKLDFNHGKDTLWLTGDIVNRGPKSLETLQFAMKHDSSVQMVLGNHDLHLLAVGYGHGSVKRSDTISPILKHPDSGKWFDWLRHQPLMVREGSRVMVHAGILPQWSIEKAGSLAREAEAELQGGKYEKFFAKMYGNKPTEWHENLEGYDRLRLIVNAFTRMRALTYKNELDYSFKATLDKMPLYLRPWFRVPDRKNLDHTIVFGHWSSLGYMNEHNIISLDTGALWGGELTAINLETQEVTQVRSKSGLDWKTLLK
ncbi:symmetrical bis(5'-nucleosyl)-tetraphosphatase [Neisseria animalis]|uniref:Bis(5'-nucleosyl)-tetraphosphatase, symmetrical n=1 Tax=Neisseria animalis TaxID=492 RepID=A0A5P3MUY2_NEIAN|nr:symmetrical bis(5'-nucleosyl)-tetraphosphatase [Neisseria animalis]QEY24581.1 symmetrical bis(5'-nucleosyl)-tetraphosphatase [Neisseria animalis]ROW33004.1 symmetrical bis(5'-nucleosyl)-tetraphosphatase [Neisseria animalis]VEE07417.1 diadenosine tetraphosphatase [Neisseria animalis]